MTEEIIRNEAVTVGVASAEVCGVRTRKSIYLRNNSSGAAAASVITVTFSDIQAAVASAGYTLGPGEYVVDSTTEGYECYSGRINAIATIAASTLTVVER